MRIVHVAPFAPGRCGLYETARDLLVAERRLGHDAVLVDAGVQGEGPHYGQVDGRAASVVEACRPEDAGGADVLVTHTAPSRAVLDATDAPIVHVMHGRPRSSYLLERAKPDTSPVWRLLRQWGRDDRHRAFVTLWPSHVRAWRCAVPSERLHTLSGPPVDLVQWTPKGDRHDLGEGVHVLVCDMWREDVDPLETLFDLAETAYRRPELGLRVHVYGLRNPLGPAVEAVLGRLRRIGALGSAKGMMRGMAAVYRSADVVVSPQRIATRTVRESLACGTPVLWAGTGYRPGDVGRLCDVLGDIAGDPKPRAAARAAAQRFDANRIAAELVGVLEGVAAAQEEVTA